VGGRVRVCVCACMHACVCVCVGGTVVSGQRGGGRGMHYRKRSVKRWLRSPEGQGGGGGCGDGIDLGGMIRDD